MSCVAHHWLSYPWLLGLWPCRGADSGAHSCEGPRGCLRTRRHAPSSFGQSWLVWIRSQTFGTIGRSCRTDQIVGIPEGSTVGIRSWVILCGGVLGAGRGWSSVPGPTPSMPEAPPQGDQDRRLQTPPCNPSRVKCPASPGTSHRGNRVVPWWVSTSASVSTSSLDWDWDPKMSLL